MILKGATIYRVAIERVLGELVNSHSESFLQTQMLYVEDNADADFDAMAVVCHELSKIHPPREAGTVATEIDLIVDDTPRTFYTELAATVQQSRTTSLPYLIMVVGQLAKDRKWVAGQQLWVVEQLINGKLDALGFVHVINVVLAAGVLESQMSLGSDRPGE